MAKLKVKKGLEANLPAVEDGSLLITTDSKKLYLDSGEERIQVGGDSGGAGTYLFHLKFTDSTESAVINIDGDFSKLSAAATNGLCVIARVHDYVDMIYFNDYYISSGLGSSTEPASPYQFNYYDGLKLNCITINDFTDTGLSYSVSSTGVRTILFTKTSSTEYTCGTDVALIVEENAVVGKVPNEGNNGYTFFYKVRDSIDNTSATPSDTVATTFISCDGNTIKKLTTQYSDYGVWHYSEQSLSGGGADSSLYSKDTSGYAKINSDVTILTGILSKEVSSTNATTTLNLNSTNTPVTTQGAPPRYGNIDMQVSAYRYSSSDSSPKSYSGQARFGADVSDGSVYLSPAEGTTRLKLGTSERPVYKVFVSDNITGGNSSTISATFDAPTCIDSPSSSSYGCSHFNFIAHKDGGPLGTSSQSGAVCIGFQDITDSGVSIYPGSEQASVGTRSYPWYNIYGRSIYSQESIHQPADSYASDYLYLTPGPRNSAISGIYGYNMTTPLLTTGQRCVRNDLNIFQPAASPRSIYNSDVQYSYGVINLQGGSNYARANDTSPYAIFNGGLSIYTSITDGGVSGYLYIEPFVNKIKGPSTTINGSYLGSSRYPFTHAYASNIRAGTIMSMENTSDLKCSANFVPITTSPSTDIGYSLGSSSKKWRYLYAFSGTIQTSDRSEKDSIHYIDNSVMTLSLDDTPQANFNIGITMEDVLDFVSTLNPATFCYKHGQETATEDNSDPEEVQLGLIADDIKDHKLFKYVGVEHEDEVEVSPAEKDEQGNEIKPAVTEMKITRGLQAIPLATAALTTCKYLLNKISELEERIIELER